MKNSLNDNRFVIKIINQIKTAGTTNSHTASPEVCGHPYRSARDRLTLWFYRAIELLNELCESVTLLLSEGVTPNELS